MPHMTPYHTAKTQPDRGERKKARNRIYLENKHANRKYQQRKGEVSR